MADVLENAVRNGRVMHAYIIVCKDMSSGEAYTMRLAMSLLCTAGELSAHPCGKCHSCMQAAAGTHPDIIRFEHEKDSSVSVDEVRKQISADVGLRPFDSDRKVYIMPDAHLMTVQAQNALLKTIEEPPCYVVMFMITPDEKLLLETVRSRCAVYRLDAGSMQDPDEGIFRENIEILTALREKDRTVIPGYASSIAGRGTGEGRNFLEFARLWYRDILVYKKTRDAGELNYKTEEKAIALSAGSMSCEAVEKALKEIDKAESRLISNVNCELTLEMALLSM